MTLNLVNVSTIFELLLTFIICLIGSSIKDIYDTLKDKDSKVNILKILISSIMSTMVVFSLSDYIYKSINPKLYLLIGTVVGTLGFEIIGFVSNLSIKKIMHSITKKVSNIDLSDIEFEDDDDEKK